jgi:two-component system, LytTR family, sensor kinase
VLNSPPKKSIDRKRVKLFLWIAFAYLMLQVFSDASSHPDTFLERCLDDIWRLAYITVLTFVLFEYTIPFIRLTWKRILAGLFLLWVHLILYSFGLYAWINIGSHLGIYTEVATFSSIPKALESHMSYSAMSVFFFGIIRHVYDYRALKGAAQQLRIEKQQSELNYLKSQTNPHFLFNTLNNIYSLARDKSDLAPESVLRLSQILRFMLYETGGAYIAIEQELKIINDYIALEKLRYDESLRVTFSYTIEDMKQAVPPLLLIPLVENAFKHGVSEARAHPFVDIHLDVLNRILTFVVINSNEAFPDGGSVKEQIGLSNLRRQLELLYTDYSLSVQQGKSVQQGDSVFTATLKINLASHV